MKKILIIAGGIILLLIIVASLGGNKEVKESFEKGKQQGIEDAQKEETTYSLNVQAKTSGASTLEVTGQSNLPDGAVLEVKANRMFILSGESDTRHGLQGQGFETASVEDGAYKTKISLDDKKFLDYVNASGETITLNPNVLVTIVFDPTKNNSSEISNIVGEKGEKLENSQQKKIIGELTNEPYNTLEVETEVPVNFPYQDQLK